MDFNNFNCNEMEAARTMIQLFQGKQQPLLWTLSRGVLVAGKAWYLIKFENNRTEWLPDDKFIKLMSKSLCFGWEPALKK